MDHSNLPDDVSVLRGLKLSNAGSVERCDSHGVTNRPADTPFAMLARSSHLLNRRAVAATQNRSLNGAATVEQPPGAGSSTCNDHIVHAVVSNTRLDTRVFDDSQRLLSELLQFGHRLQVQFAKQRAGWDTCGMRYRGP